MKKIFNKIATNLVTKSKDKLTGFDDSKTVKTIRDGVDVAERTTQQVSKVLFWLKAIAYSLFAFVFLLVVNLVVMLFT